MKVPKVDQAVVPDEKLNAYLLSKTHRDGRHKAAFFFAHGFAADAPADLAEALLKHARSHEVAKEEASPFGRRYVVEGTMEAADGRRPNLRTVWFIENGEDTPRFVTAYPLPGDEND
jgi:hypothetical protein